MFMSHSIYQLICSHIKDGCLDEHFSLPQENSASEEVLFAPGAMDGIILYHMGMYDLDDAQTESMSKALLAAAEGDALQTDRLFAELTRSVRIIRMIDSIQNYILFHSADLNPENVYQTACSLILHSAHTECVKAGIVLLGMFAAIDADIKEAIRMLSLSDEFSLFAFSSMLTWPGGNEEIFSAAKKVHGWGRIHAAEYLQPDTEEIRRWFLTDGCKNEILAAYSALTCWRKSGAEQILFSAPTTEAYIAIGVILEGLLDEGPVAGISCLENAADILLRYLQLSENYSLSAQDRERIQAIRQRQTNL
jgi:hypothetical protein